MIKVCCEICKKDFDTYPSLKRKYCSRVCFSEARKVLPMPWLKEFIKKGSTSNTGRTHFKKGMTPWNKGTKGLIKSWNKGRKGLQIAWNKGLKGCVQIAGENNGIWKGDDVSYRSLHKWVERKLGKPNECEVCYTKGMKRAMHWANISRQYKRDINDWARLCPKCHRAYDMGRLTLERG